MPSNLPTAPDVHGTSYVDNIHQKVTASMLNQFGFTLNSLQGLLLAGGQWSLDDHKAAADPHPIYLTQTEADSRYVIPDSSGHIDAWLTEHAFKHVLPAPTGVPATDNAIFAALTSGFYYQAQIGTYVVDPAVLTSSAASVTFLGVHGQTIFQLSSQGGGAPAPILTIQSAAVGVTFQDIIFDQNRSTIAVGGGNYWSGVVNVAGGNTGTTFRRCTFQNTARSAVYANGATSPILNLTVDDCNFTSIGNAGAGNSGACVMFDGGVHDSKVIHSHAYGTLASNFVKVKEAELPSSSTTYTVQAGSTATSIIANGTPWTAAAYNDRATIRFFTGALAGQERLVSANTNNTATTVAFSAAPATGDTFRLYPKCFATLIAENHVDFRSNTTFDATYGALGIEIFNGGWYSRVLSNHVYGPDTVPTAGYFWPISLGDARGSVVGFNEVVGGADPQASAYGIEVAECPQLEVIGNQVRNVKIGSNFTNNNPLPSHAIIISGNTYENCYENAIVSDSAPSSFKIISNTFIDCGVRYIFFNSINVGGGNGTVKSGILGLNTFQIRNQTRLDSEGHIFAVYISSQNETDISDIEFIGDIFEPHPAGIGTVALLPIQINKPRAIRISQCIFNGLAPTGGAKEIKAIFAFSGDLHANHNTYKNFSSTSAAFCSLSAAATAPLSTFEYNINGGGNGASNTHGISSDANTPFSVTWWDANGHLRTLEWSANGVTAPTAAAGANAGTSSPAPVVNSLSTDRSARVTYGTGTAPAAGEQLVITFHKPFVNVPQPTVSAMNAATQALGLYVSAISTTSVSIASTNAPGISQPNTTYDVVVHVWPT
jgi:hypothetical protein